MKIIIEMKESSTIRLKAALLLAGATDIKVSGHQATCDIPQEDVTPYGKMNVIFEALGGTSNVKSVILAR